MADEQRPAPRPVKRIIKKTVVRPPGAHGPMPPVRRRGGGASSAGKALSTHVSTIASRVTGGARSAALAIGSATGRRVHAVRDWRIPRLPTLPASLITGAIVGLVTVALTLAALALFSAVRGVSSGGWRWGSLTFVVVAFVAFVLGELLLSAFGSAQARLVSFLGVVLTIVVILALFLDLADSGWALLVVPATAAVAYAVSHWLLDLAESSSQTPE